MPQLKERQSILDPGLTGRWRSYLLQCLLASGYILLMFLCLELIHGWAIASLGASTFIAFTFPQANSSRPRYLIGGYCVALVIGGAFSAAASFLESCNVPYPVVICCGVATFLAMFVMVCLDFEHPPAVAMTLTLVLSDHPFPVGLMGVGCILVLCGIKLWLLPWLHDL